MPEGHTVHRSAKQFADAFLGKPVRVDSPQGRFSASAKLIDGQPLKRARAVGKQLFLEFENGYTLRIVNKDTQARNFRIRVVGPEGITLVEANAVHAAAAEEVLTVPVTLRAPAGVAKGRVDVDFVVESDAEGVSETEETRFFGPF